MRIAFLVHAFPELSETFILRQATGLIDRGHDIAIFADTQPGTMLMHEDVAAYDLLPKVRLLSADGAGRSGLSRLATMAARPAVVLPYLTASGIEPFRDRVRDVAAVRMLAAEPRFDIVHCHFGDIGLRYRYAARLWHAPLIVSFYGFDCSTDAGAKWAGRYVPLTAEADAVTVLSEDMAKRVTGFGFRADRLHRIPLCIDPDRFRTEPAAATDGTVGGLRVLTVARLAPKKGVRHAIEAFAGVARRFPDAHFDVIGDGPLRAELQSLVDRLGLDTSVTLHGWRAESDVLGAMRSADVFVLPSVTAEDGDSEGTPVVLLEAAACGLPVLSTRHAGIPEIVIDGETGILVEEGDVDALGDGLGRLLDDAALRSRLGCAGRRRVVEKHACSRMIDQLEALYVSVSS